MMQKSIEMMDKSLGISSAARSLGGNITEAATDAVDYVRRRGVRRMGRDLSKCVSRNPVQSMIALTALGFFTGMLAMRRH
jgi:hypothetical protein